MKDQGCECQACYSRRRAYFLMDYGPTPHCWVCALVMRLPARWSDPIYRLFGGAEESR